ncbi:MAG: NPCBM/NEW2 domain-containing protein [Abditibacteriota bacterium]|nr:NPCBM/NEW2 domain-containing protein [Abditibacteriota bacterium]
MLRFIFCAAVIFLLPLLAQASEFITDNTDLIISETCGFGKIGYDTADVGLADKPTPLRVNGKIYDKGIGTHANGTIEVALDGGYSRFEAEVGTQEYVIGSDTGSVVFVVKTEYGELFRSPVLTSHMDPVPVSVDVTGATSLYLIVEDGGDGITNDGCCWLNARLTKASAAAAAKHLSIDIAPSGRVTKSDPARIKGTAANRVEAIPAEDIFLTRNTYPDARGLYTATPTGGRCAIGLSWMERRRIKTCSIEFEGDAPQNVSLEFWARPGRTILDGESYWQGEWVPVNADVTRKGKVFTASLAGKTNIKETRNGVMQLRWVFDSDKPLKVKQLTAFSARVYKEGRIRITPLKKQGEVTLTGYNMDFVTDKGRSHTYTGNFDSEKTLEVIYTAPVMNPMEQSVLRFDGFGVSLRDLEESKGVYSSKLGWFVSMADKNVTPEEYLADYKGKTKIVDMVAAHSEQTFENALKNTAFDAQKNSLTLLSLPGDNYKFALDRNGSLRFDTDEKLVNEYAQQGAPFDQVRVTPEPGKDAAISRRLEYDWTPIQHTEWNDGAVLCTQRAFVYPVDDQQPAAIAQGRALGVTEWTMENLTRETVSAEIAFGYAGNTPITLEEALPATETGNKMIALKDGKVCFYVTDYGLLTESDGRFTVKAELGPGETKRFAILFPRFDMTPEELIPWNESMLRQTDTLWRDLIKQGATVSLPDKQLENAILGSVVAGYITARNKDRSQVAPWIGAVNYGTLESEAQSVIRGMEFWGQKDWAQSAHDYFLSIYRKEGYLANFYTIFGNGWHLDTLGDFNRLFGDPEWLRPRQEQLRRNAGWIIDQIGKTKEQNEDGSKVWEYGLFPPGVNADWAVYAYYFNHDAYNYAGLNSVADILEDLGDSSAEGIRKEAAELKENAFDAYKRIKALRALVPTSSGEWVAAIPCQVYEPVPIGDMYPGDDFGRAWCNEYEMGVTHLMAKGIIPADSPEASDVLDNLEELGTLSREAGYNPYSRLISDVFNIGGFTKVQPYYARYGEAIARTGNVKLYLRNYFNTLAAHLNRENMTFHEHLAGTAAPNKTHETGYFLYHSRQLFADEDGDTLRLCRFAPREWFYDGAVVNAVNIPTFFGPVSLEIKADLLKQQKTTAVLKTDFRRLPEKLTLRLPHLKEQLPVRVLVNGRERVPEGDTVRLLPGMGEKTITVVFEY